ncbi:MAG: DUF6383 domain-containing protein [Candidatus Limisoma sp.]
MKKSLLQLALCGIATLSLSANAQTLTQDWKFTEDIPATGNARWGVGQDGKIWTNDKSVPQVYYWDETGKHLPKFGDVDVIGGGAGTGISIDDAGNLIISNGFAAAGAMTSMKILPAGEGTFRDIAITMPEGATAGRMDYMGRAKGNVMMDGGVLYAIGNSSEAIVALPFANGTYNGTEARAIPTPGAGGTDGFIQPLDSDLETDNILVKNTRSVKFALWDGENYTTPAYPSEINTTAGGDAVILNGVRYTVHPAGTDYADGFVVYDESGTVIATHEVEVAAASPYGNALNFEKIDEYTARIYQYVPGRLVAQYTLEFPKPIYIEARNAYPYDIKVQFNGTDFDVTYRLNAPASAVKVQLVSDGAVYKEYAGTTIAYYTDDTKTEINNLNKVTVPFDDFKFDARTVVQVAVTSDVVTTPTVSSTSYKFWSPYGVVVDNNPNSAHFGRILVTEAQSSLPATGYHTSTGENGTGTGIYAFDQLLQPIKNAEGKYGFQAGLTQNTTYPSSTTAVYDFKRLAMSDDGRIFLGRAGIENTSLWELNPDDLSAAATEVFQGTLGTDGIVTDDSGNFVAGPATALDVYGSGNGLKVAVVSCKEGYALSQANHRVNIYNLGKNTTWNAAPSQSLEAISGQYWINSATVNAKFDADGEGLMVGQYRGAPNETEPSYKHVNLNTGVIDYSDITTLAAGAGMAWNADKTLMAMATGKATVGIFKVTKDESGVPTFTKLYDLATTCGTNTNAMAFDVADNLYLVSNSGELFKAFSLPRESGEVVVPAARQYSVTMTSDGYPAELFLMSDHTGWKANTGIKLTKEANGIYKGTIEGNCWFAFTTMLGDTEDDWDIVNESRYAHNTNKEVVLNTPAAIEQVADGSMHIAAEGTFNLTVDLANMTVLIEGEATTTYPEKLHVVGGAYNWDPTLSYELAKVGEGVYKGTVTTAEGKTNFAICENIGDWDTINASRWGFAQDNATATLNEPCAIVKGNGAINVPGVGDFDVTVDLVNMTVLIEGEVVVEKPESLYLIGNLDDTGLWDLTATVKLTKDPVDAVFTAKDVKLFPADNDGFAYFAFTSVSSTNWDEVNAFRYGPAVDGTEVADGVEAAFIMANTSFKALGNTYDIKVDFDALTVKLVKKDGGVESVVNAVAVVAGVGNIRILGEAQSVSIHTVNGQAIAVNSNERSFNVTKGIYLVTVDGKTTKVLVK